MTPRRGSGTALHAVLIIVLAMSGCTGTTPVQPTGADATSGVTAEPRDCALTVIRDGDGPGARVQGTGYQPDATVVLTIADASGTVTLTEDELPLLRTDIRGVFLFPIAAERENIGVATFEASAGDCSARSTSEVTAAMFVPECRTVEPAATGGELGRAYEALILADRPIQYWRFEEDSGDTASAAAGEPAAYKAAPSLAAPGFVEASRAVGLDGVDDWVDIPDLALADDFTIEAWVFLCGDTVDNADAVVGQAGPGPDINFFEETLRLFDGGGDPAVASRPIEAGRWVHVAVARRSGQVTLYLDAEAVGSGGYTPAFPVAAIGWGNAGLFQGGIDEVAIYDHAVAADRLAERVAAGGG